MSDCYIEFIRERITTTKSIIEAIEAAILALTTDKVQSYDLDTGQNRSKVTKLDVPRLNQELSRLYARVKAWCEEIDEDDSGVGSGNVVEVRPSW